MSDEHEAAAFMEALNRGIEHFNEQAFEAAYEVWQARWMEECGEGADLLQGLLQLAVGFAKLQGGNPRGTVKLLEQGARLLGAYAPAAYGLDVNAVLAIAEQWRLVAAKQVEDDGIKR